MEGRLTEGGGTRVNDEGAAFELRGRPEGWWRGGRVKGEGEGDTRVKLGREGTRRDARARARAQLNNGLPYPPSLLTRALPLFVLFSLPPPFLPAVFVAVAVAVAITCL